MALIDSLCYEEAELKVKEKVNKHIRKIEKEIQELEGPLLKKKEKLIRRIDTGLETIRVSHSLPRKVKLPAKKLEGIPLET